MKRLPIGIESFKVLAKECYFVDKTEFIHEVNRFPSTSVLLFTRPRRFGKSTNLSMLKCFYESGLEDPAPYFKGTDIEKRGEDLKDMGRYPVVSISFKNHCPKSFLEMLQELASVMKEEYLRHREDFDKANLIAPDKAAIEDIYAEKGDKTFLSHSLSLLVRLLASIHKEKVVVLVDEYDALMQEAYDQRFHEEAIAFFKTFYGSALKGNDSLRLAVLTGVFEIAKDSLSSSLNNPNVFTVLDDAFSSYFGFSETEASKTLSYFGMERSLAEAKEWYGGYRIGDTEIINPWSLLNFIAKGGVFAPYWTNTSSFSVFGSALLRFSQSQDALSALLTGDKRIAGIVDATISYSDIFPNRSALLSFLLFLGYLTPFSKLDENGAYLLGIPNREITSVFQKEILDRFYAETGFDAVLDFRKYLSQGDPYGMKNILERSLLSSLNYFDFGSEKVYQGMILALISIAYKDAAVESEVVSGTGRCDIMLTPKNPNNPGICLELKRLLSRSSEDRMVASSLEALNQIKKKDYGERLRKLGVKKILYYGICFHKKKVVVSHEEEA